jgi:hypothetical protein
MIPIPSPMHQLLIDNGYNCGWGLCEEQLVLWEHEVDPPSPLVRPEEPDD